MKCLLAVCAVAMTMTVHALPSFPFEFDDDGSWEACPTFLSNPAESASITQRDGIVTLSVSEKGKGMKFQIRPVPRAADGWDYLVFRYRASGLARGYAIWIYDDMEGGHELINTRHLRQDGAWHIAAIDLYESGVSGPIRGILTEVQCADAPASITFDYIRLTHDLPADADEHTSFQGKPTVPDFSVFPAQREGLEAQPDWLNIDAETYTSASIDGALHLRVEGKGKGMKWSLPAPTDLDLSKYKYVAVRYRARHIKPHGDYFIWLGSEAGGAPPDHQQLMRLSHILDDDEWHIKTIPVLATFTVAEFAFQVVASDDIGEVWIEKLVFSADRPRFPATEMVPNARGWEGVRIPQEAIQVADLGGLSVVSGEKRCRRYGLSSWFPEGDIQVREMPFRIGAGSPAVQVAGATASEKIPIRERASEVYVLMASEPPTMNAAKMGKPTPMEQFSNPERFRFEVSYVDGIVDEHFPVCVGSGRYEIRRGVGVYAFAGLRDVAIGGIRAVSRMDSARFLIGGVSWNTGEPVVSIPPVLSLPPAVRAIAAYPGESEIVEEGDGAYLIGNDVTQLVISVTDGIALKKINNGCLFDVEMSVEAGPLFELGIEDTVVGSDRLVTGTPVISKEGETCTLAVPVDGRSAEIPISGVFRVSAGPGTGIQLDLDIKNGADRVIVPMVRFPVVKGLHLGDVKDTWYLYAQRGGIIGRDPAQLRRTYGGEYPLQVMDVFHPSGGGLLLRTEDAQGIYRYWELEKNDSGVTWSVDYWRREFQPGETIPVATTVLDAHTGDWRRALDTYKEWAQTWYSPQAPRKDWFLDVYYYQQSTAWNRLRDPKTGKWRMMEKIERYRDYFGCFDYLHIFDFGQSKVYGRVGDYNHYDEFGGLETMRSAIAEAQKAGVRIGLYIEGYLCDERGEWGSKYATTYDIRKENGESLLWPGTPTEHMMCPAAEPWRQHLASTYKRVSDELKPDGMYIDQYGFINTWKVCHSRKHGHPVPNAPMLGERDTTRAIRSALPDTIANLTEETPNDVTSQYQDGALGYSVTTADPILSPHRVDLFRFMFPDFKVFQLVQYNHFLDGGWHLLKFPFFNGEGFWLHGMTEETYCEDAHQFLKDAFRILHENADAFRSSQIKPLVGTLHGTIYVNEFRGKESTVWTLFNAEYQTYRGPVLEILHRNRTVYKDGFTGKEVTPDEVKRSRAVLSFELGPRRVGCIVATRLPKK